MAHIPNSFAPPSDKSIKNVFYAIPEGGMLLSEKASDVAEGKCALCKNLDIDSGALFPRMSVSSQSLPIENDGSIHCVTKEPFCEKLIMHMGTNLYSFGDNDTSPVLIYTSLPDKKSLFCHFMSKLYIYCDGRVFSLDNSFALTEENPDAPVLYTNVTPVSGGIAKRIDNSPINLVSPRITVEYAVSDDTAFYLPIDADITRKVEVICDNEEITQGITLAENRIIVKNPDSADRQVSISYTVKNHSEIGYDTRLYDCSLSISFGGNANGGTRVFFTGDENKKGVYYKSALQNPLLVLSDDYEIIGDGCENITALKKMYGNLIVFTENSVFKMGYLLNNDGTFFSTKEISHGIGCDCPDSVQLIDNRVVFANSKKGIFIVSETDDTGEHNIKPVSRNIEKGKGEGLLDNSAESLKKACSVDFDRKYMLFVGDRAYIWDYDESSFVDSQNYSQAQRRLKWYVYDSLLGDGFYVVGKSLVSFTGEDNCFRVYSQNTDCDGFECVVDSGLLGLSNPFERKYLCGLELILAKKNPGIITLELSCDGEVFYIRDVQAHFAQKSKLRFKLPYSIGFCYGFRICSDTGFELYGANIKYKYI